MSCDSNWAHVTKAIYRQVNFSSHPPDQRNRDMMGPTVHTVGLSPYLEIKVMNGTSLWLSCFLGLGFEGLYWLKASSWCLEAASIKLTQRPCEKYWSCIRAWSCSPEWSCGMYWPVGGGLRSSYRDISHRQVFSPSEGKVQYRLWAVNDFTFTCIFL